MFNSSDPAMNAALAVLVVTAAMVLIVFGAIVILPTALVGGLFYMAYKSNRDKRNTPPTTAKLVQAATITTIPTVEQFMEASGRAVVAAVDHPVPVPVLTLILEAISDLYSQEHLAALPPSPPEGTIEHARYRDFLINRASKLTDAQATVNHISKACSEMGLSLVSYLPRSNEDGEEHPSVPLINTINTASAIMDVCAPFFKGEIKNLGLFKELRKQLDSNFDEAGHITSFDGMPHEMVFAYLKKTPLLQLFDATIPFIIGPETQFAHTWVVAGSGHGKTTALTSMLHPHINEVIRGESSIVLIDSQNAIIPALERLEVWEGTDRLIVVDPTDPIAFSLFDVPKDQLNTALEMIEFIFAKLSDSEVTYRQKNMFEYLSEFLITAVPNATIYDFRNMLDSKRAMEYDQYKSKASLEVQDYLATDFVKEKFTVDARFQVLTKLRGLLRQPAFAQMFGSPKTKLNLFKELDRGVCILIKPDKYKLGDDGTRLFGRFWIAQMQLVAQMRQNSCKKTPTYFYIDECQDYLKGGDPKIEGILEQARKQKIGLTLLHHYGDQLKSNDLLQLLGANTATKMCGSPASTDLARFASYLQCSPGFIQAQEPMKSFAVHVRGKTKSAVSLSFPYINLANKPQMSAESLEELRARNRERYGANPKEIELMDRGVPPVQLTATATTSVPATARRTENRDEVRAPPRDGVEPDPTKGDPNY